MSRSIKFTFWLNQPELTQLRDMLRDAITRRFPVAQEILKQLDHILPYDVYLAQNYIDGAKPFLSRYEGDVKNQEFPDDASLFKFFREKKFPATGVDVTEYWANYEKEMRKLRRAAKPKVKKKPVKKTVKKRTTKKKVTKIQGKKKKR